MSLSEQAKAALQAHDDWQRQLHATVRGIAMAAQPDLECGGRRVVLSNDDFDALNILFAPPGLMPDQVEAMRPPIEVLYVAWENLAIVRFDPLPDGSPACRACGCWEQRACYGGCFWAEPDLCSSCAQRKEEEVAYRDRPTRPALFDEGEAVELLVARLPDGSERLVAIRGRPSEWIQEHWRDSQSAESIGLPDVPGLYAFQGTWREKWVYDDWSGGSEIEDVWLGECRAAMPEDLYLLSDEADVPCAGESTS